MRRQSCLKGRVPFFLRTLLQEGRDTAATERALRSVLEIAPDHGETPQNLDVLMRQQGRKAV